MKKLICLILVITTVFSIHFTVFADYENTHLNTGEHADDFVSVALTQIGYKAENGSKYSENQNYNIDFITWVAKEADIPDHVIPYAHSAQELYDFFNEKEKIYTDNYIPQKGDIIIFQDEGSLTECAIVISADDKYVTAVICDSESNVNKKMYALGIAKIYAYASPDFTFTSKYEEGTYITTASTLNFRAGPGTDNDITDKIPMGTIVEIKSFKGDWGYTYYNGKNGWVSMDYASKYEDSYHNIGAYAVNWKVIDVSKWQGKIDWAQVASAGFKAVILRIGLRGSVSREILIDDKFLEYYEGAKAQGLYIGCYFYSAAKSVSDAEKEAEFVLKTIKENNIELDMPAYIDMEDSVIEKCGKTAIFNMTKAYLDTMDAANIYSGVYCSAYWATDYYNKTLFNSHALWIADWSGSCDYTGEYGMWQYSEKGRINGIETKYTDLNTCYVNYPELIADYGYNTEDESSYSTGDIDRNGQITAADARLVLRFSAQLDIPTDYQSIVSDIDGNKKITAADARLLLRISAGLADISDYTSVTEIESEFESELMSETESDI